MDNFDFTSLQGVITALSAKTVTLQERGLLRKLDEILSNKHSWAALRKFGRRKDFTRFRISKINRVEVIQTINEFLRGEILFKRETENIISCAHIIAEYTEDERVKAQGETGRMETKHHRKQPAIRTSFNRRPCFAISVANRV